MNKSQPGKYEQQALVSKTQNKQNLTDIIIVFFVFFVKKLQPTVGSEARACYTIVVARVAGRKRR